MLGIDISSMLDVQAQAPRWKFKLIRVGVTGVKKCVVIRRGDEKITLIPQINVYVDLPPTKKGSHLSRNIETLNELVDQTVRDPVGAQHVCACAQKRIYHSSPTFAPNHLWARFFGLVGGALNMQKIKNGKNV